MPHKKKKLEAVNDDIVVEEEETPHTSFKPKTDSALKAELAAVKKERADYLDGWQRAKAELINSKKTFEEAKKRYRDIATEDLVSELIPVLDSFDMAFRDKRAWEEAPVNWRTGIEYIYNQLVSVLERNDVEQINPVGDVFDPAKHESVDTKPVTDQNEHNRVQSVLQKGYMLRGKVVRAARVVIGEHA